jgi:hypothetical protein
MCNPRRVEITATRQVAEAWQREVERVAEQAMTITGEARVRHALDASVAAPALAALEAALEAGMPGWQRVGEASEASDAGDASDASDAGEASDAGGYRCDVDGGYVLYLPGTRTLEIVAVVEGEVRGRGSARSRLEGRVEAAVEGSGESIYYDDGYGGRTQDVAEQEARQEADLGIARQVAARLDEAARTAEAAADAELRARAEEAARADLQARAAAHRQALDAHAAEHLQAVGARARQAFHRLLAVAYRDALLALARARGAQDIHCSDSGEVLEIEFLLPD